MGTRTRYRRKARVKQRQHLKSGVDWTLVGQLKPGQSLFFTLQAAESKVLPSIRTYASRVAAKKGRTISVSAFGERVLITRVK